MALSDSVCGLGPSTIFKDESAIFADRGDSMALISLTI